MITAQDASQKAGDYIAANQPGAMLDLLLEDDTDYFAQAKLSDPGGAWPLGVQWVFIRKNDGQVWTETPPLVLDKVDGMSPVGEEAQA